MLKPTTSTIHILETLALQIAVFLIPSNLAYHINISAAYVNGRLSDYALPKLYASDLPILFLICIYLYKKRNNIDLLTLIKNEFFNLLIFLLLISLSSASPLSGIWYTLKLLEYYLFGRYLLSTYTYSSFSHITKVPFIASLFFQSLLAIYQYINQLSLFGYIFLGEPDLKSLGVATTTLRGYLEVMPYGTTAHPNILAGFFTTSLLLLFVSSQLSLKKWLKQAVDMLLIGLLSLIIVLTQSISALSGLIGIIIFKLAYKLHSTLRPSVIFQIIIYSTLILSLIFYPISHHLNVAADNPSFYIRYELNHQNLVLFIQNPLSGVGPNQSTLKLSPNPLSGQQSLTLQPPHHGLILMLAETGLIGLLLICINLRHWFTATSRQDPSFTSFFPILSLYIILLLDHYPLTLQTGQLLTLFALVVPLLKRHPISSS